MQPDCRFHCAAPGTRIAFFDDRIEVENPGILLPGMTIEDMKQGVSKIRNAVIARVFRELGLIEQWGSGVRRIFKEAEELGLPEMQIGEIGMRLRFIVPLKEQIAAKTKTEQAGTKLALSRHQVDILRKCKEKSALLDLMAITGRSDRTKFRNQVLNPLLDMGLIEMTIPDKPRSSKQKYRLTDKGRRVLAGYKKDAG